MDRTDFELQGFTDSNGRLNSYAGGGGAIWIPPEAKIGSLPDKTGALVNCVLYPLPKKFCHPIGNKPFKSDDSERSMDLYTWGWERKADTTNVLEDFIKLTEASSEMIRQFVLKWGPLWLCTQHDDCFWTPAPRLRDESWCFWIPAEPLGGFRRLAKQAKAAFDISVHLRNDKPVPEHLWKTLGWSGKEQGFSLSEQKFFLTSSINGYLTLPGGPSIWVRWEEQKPELVIDTGLGFLRVVWLMIAQCLTGAKGLYFCDGCGAPYIRHTRKPQQGRKTFCPECSKGGKGSKRVYEQSKRLN